MSLLSVAATLHYGCGPRCACGFCVVTDDIVNVVVAESTVNRVAVVFHLFNESSLALSLSFSLVLTVFPCAGVGVLVVVIMLFMFHSLQ